MTMDRKKQLIEFIDTRGDTYKKIALDIHEHPEVSNYEFYACKRLSEQLSEEGFEVKTDVAGHRTGFSAVYQSGKPGPVLAFLAEYDALEGLGHGCGHNLFGSTSLLAAAALKQVIQETGGEIRVYGTPGEEGGENGSAKGSFVREGFFQDVDAALCVHPGADTHKLTGASLGCAPVDIEFWGVCGSCFRCTGEGDKRTGRNHSGIQFNQCTETASNKGCTYPWYYHEWR
jgi:metal-dependent amidase/aminoacylase/carboxypeptidase family protein